MCVCGGGKKSVLWLIFIESHWITGHLSMFFCVQPGLRDEGKGGEVEIEIGGVKISL